MDIFTFLNKAQHEDFFVKHKTICLHGKKEAFPLLFFSTIFNRLKKNNSIAIEKIDAAQEDIASIMARLSSSFLGSTSVYWLGDFSALKPKKQKSLLQFLKTYAGPNSVLFFIDQTVVSTKDFKFSIAVPEKLDRSQCKKLISLLLGAQRCTQGITKICERCMTIGLDDACVLVQYFAVAGKSIDVFADTWLNKIVSPEHSLQALSSCFFAKDVRKFFSLWSNMGGEYSPQFWISFWSDQLWRAFNFIEQSKKQQYLEAKRVSFRLPYKFVNGGWRAVACRELKTAHQFLYDLDYGLKNGGSAIGLELFYENFFAASLSMKEKSQKNHLQKPSNI